MNFLENVVTSLLANIIFWLGLGLVVWAIVKVTQSRLLRFFGLESTRTLIVYLSNAWTPTVERPVGYLVSGHEFRVAESISQLFGSTPFRFPELVRGLVDSFWIGEKIKARVEISPPTPNDLVFTNMVIVGSALRNALRRHYVDTNAPYLMFDWESELAPGDVAARVYSRTIRVTRGERKGETITGEYNPAIIEKMYDDEHHTTVFMCVGYRGDSSWASTEYLVRHWGDLSRKYGEKAFAICIAFPRFDVWMEDYQEPTLIASFPF